MAEGAAGAGGGAFDNILSNWTSIANLLLAVLLGGLVPILNWAFKKQRSRSKEKKDKQKVAIQEIAEEVNKPVNSKITEMEGVMTKQYEQSETILSHLETIMEKYDQLEGRLKVLDDKQQIINVRTAYIDNYFRENIKFQQSKRRVLSESEDDYQEGTGKAIDQRRKKGNYQE